MIPALRHILATHTFLARRYGWKSRVDELMVQGCLREARTLASQERDEPAALFFVFCKAWTRLGEACAVLPDLLAKNHARSIGADLAVEPGELRALRLRIALGGAVAPNEGARGAEAPSVPFAVVQAFFEARLSPRPAPQPDGAAT